VSTALSAPQHYPRPQQSPETPDWKQLLAERVEAHRARSGAQPATSTPNFRPSAPGSRASHIARAVASRYAEQPAYSDVVAATLAAHAAQQAEAEEYAAVQASRAMAQQAHWAEQEAAYQAEIAYGTDIELPLFSSEDEARGEGEQQFAERYDVPVQTSGTAVMPKFAERSQEMHLHQAPREAEPSLEELLASSVVEPRAYLPSKLIEFPREMVSTYKSRPRVPDPPVPVIPGDVLEPGPSQLRIFEVQPEPGAQQTAAGQPAISSEQDVRGKIDPALPESAANAAHTKSAAERPRRGGVSQVPIGDVASTANRMGMRSTAPTEVSANAPGVRTFKGLEWAAISLDKDPATYARKRFVTEADTGPSLIEPASIDRRVMAFAVDFSAVTGAFLGFLAVFAAATPRLPSGLTAVMLAAAVYVGLWLLYQMLFFSLSGATAGMLYARIALCTFNDQNPSRSALRRRLAAWWLSCLPLGLGFFWSFLDDDNLSWHDRMTGMYQRTY